MFLWRKDIPPNNKSTSSFVIRGYFFFADVTREEVKQKKNPLRDPLADRSTIRGNNYLGDKLSGGSAIGGSLPKSNTKHKKTFAA